MQKKNHFYEIPNLYSVVQSIPTRGRFQVIKKEVEDLSSSKYIG